MAEFSIGGRVYNLDKLRLGEVKAVAVINDEPIGGDIASLVDRYARIAEAATARFGDAGFKAAADSECTVPELAGAAKAILTLGGFITGAPEGEAKAAAG